MGNYITLDIEFQAIKDFLSKTLEAIDTETAAICEQEEAGEFRGIDDFSNALFIPKEREAIAIRAVFYEINALVEWELHALALEAYHNRENRTTIIKPVYDIPIGEIHKLIEQYYEIKFCHVPGFAEVQHIRQAVNAFKHRKGFKDFRRERGSKIFEKFQPTREDAYKAIDGTRAFLRALWGILGI